MRRNYSTNPGDSDARGRGPILDEIVEAKEKGPRCTAALEVSEIVRLEVNVAHAAARGRAMAGFFSGRSATIASVTEKILPTRVC